MSRSNIVKCVDNKTKREIYLKFKNKVEKSKTKLAKSYSISTRTLNRILDEVSGENKLTDAVTAMNNCGKALENFGKSFSSLSTESGVTSNIHCAEYDYTVTKKQITVMKDGDSRSVIRGYPRFKEIKESLVKEDFSDAVLSEVWELLNLPKYIAKFTEGQLTVDHEKGKVWYGTFEIKNSLSDQLIKMLNQGKDVKGFVRFMEKLMDNPDKHIVDQLYPFMQHNNINISVEGDIIGYRAVDGNFKDYATGKMDNSVGNTLKMPRTLVDCDPERTCSAGLHVAAREYAENFKETGGRLLQVLVNPKNVCSVPVDYDGMKMRCCEFTVLSEIV
ncbi:putative protector from prophage-induced early lysis [Vibrio phage 277E43-1]|nr:putative protector from prophage-induced early lysis [Vibrio phage 277E43-1]